MNYKGDSPYRAHCRNRIGFSSLAKLARHHLRLVGKALISLNVQGGGTGHTDGASRPFMPPIRKPDQRRASRQNRTVLSGLEDRQVANYPLDANWSTQRELNSPLRLGKPTCRQLHIGCGWQTYPGLPAGLVSTREGFNTDSVSAQSHQNIIRCALSCIRP